MDSEVIPNFSLLLLRSISRLKSWEGNQWSWRGIKRNSPCIIPGTVMSEMPKEKERRISIS